MNMKVLVEIPDQKVASPVLEMLKAYTSITTTILSSADVAALKEIRHIKDAYKLASKVRSGDLKTRPARDLLNEL